MIFIGIDVASTKHDISIINEYGVVLKDNFTIQNNLEGFKKLHTEILSHMKSDNIIHIGIEETGIYSKNICNFLRDCGFTVYMINPLLTTFNRKASSLRNTKTDKIDSLNIALFLSINYNNLNPYTPTLYTENELKSLTRLRFDKMKYLSKSKMELKRLLSIMFPEFLNHFDPLSKWGLDLLKNNSTPSSISRMHIDTLINKISVHGDRFSKANLLKDIAKNSIGTVNTTNKLLIESVIDDIYHYQKQIDKIDEEINIIMKDFEYLTSIPGVGNITGAIIVGEIGNIERFNSSTKLLAFAGLDPSVYESGNFKSTNSKISKRGSKYLRSAIFTSTKMAIIGKTQQNVFRNKYQKKINQGKHHNSAICNCSKNMVNVIYAILKSKEEFNYNI